MKSLYRKVITVAIWLAVANAFLAGAMPAEGTAGAKAPTLDPAACKVSLKSLYVVGENRRDVLAGPVSPKSRVVVPLGCYLVFEVKYEFPENSRVILFVEPNTIGYNGFSTSPTSLCSGSGEISSLFLCLGRAGEFPTLTLDKPLLLKSARFIAEEEGASPLVRPFISDEELDAVFLTADGQKAEDGTKLEVLEPTPLPPEVSTSLIPGWTEDFEKAKARAKEEGKFVLAYFLNSRPSAKGADNAPRCLDAAVLGSREFLDEIGKDFVPFMQEMHRGCWSWTAYAQFGNVVEYAMRPKQGGKAKRSAGSSFSPPEVAIIAPDGKRVCLLEKGGWEGGAVGYLAKVKREFESAKAAYEEAMKVHEKAKKLVPPKTDTTSTPPGFIDDLDAAFAMAKAKGKLVFACFTGSDWCHWCKKLDNEILSKPEFYAGVKEDFVLVFIDMPNDKNLLSEHAKKANGGLVKKYGIKGFPMALIFDGDGKRLGEIGYEVGGPAPYVKSLMKFRNKGE